MTIQTSLFKSDYGGTHPTTAFEKYKQWLSDTQNEYPGSLTIISTFMTKADYLIVTYSIERENDD